MTLESTLFYLSGALLVLTYGGFAAILGAVAIAARPFARKRTPTPDASFAPAVTVYFSALNEEENIHRRLDNLFDTDYDHSKVNVIVVSDGSTDATGERTREYIAAHPERNITLLELPENLGPAHAQNRIPHLAKTDIVIATDADATFQPTTIPRLIAPFHDDRVAVVGAVVIYRDPGNSSVAYGYTRYRAIEKWLRAWESLLGVLVKVDGPAVAYRLAIWEELEPFEHVDQVICLLAKRKNVRAIQANDAVCYDWANTKPKQELAQRARMTCKALRSTFHRWGLAESIAYPGFTLALWLHKLVRFFSPLLLVTFLVSFVFYADARVVLAALVTVAALSLFKRARDALQAFFWAQLSFAKGILAWMKGDRSGRYTPTRRLGS